MPPSPDSIADVASAIQLALAPVFLLTGIAGLLNVMAGRLSRIVDRARTLTERNDARFERSVIVRELQGLERRRHLTSVAITSCTIAALMLCSVIVTLCSSLLLTVTACHSVLRPAGAGNASFCSRR